MKKRGCGLSYNKRVADIVKEFDSHSRSGLSNREIWRRYIYPVYFISERTLYNMINASAHIEEPKGPNAIEQLLKFED